MSCDKHAPVLLNSLNLLRKREQCIGKPHILSFYNFGSLSMQQKFIWLMGKEDILNVCKSVSEFIINSFNKHDIK